MLRRHPGLRWGGAWAEAEAAAWDGAKGVWLEGTGASGVAKQAPPGGGDAAGDDAAGGDAAGGVAAEVPLPALQGALLRQAASFVRPGGRLVYATCSLDPTENAAVAAAFERGEQGAAFAPWPFAADVAGAGAAAPADALAAPP